MIASARGRLASRRIAVADVMLPRGAFQAVQTVKSMTDGGGDAELQAARDEGDHQHQLCNIISRDEAKALELKRYFTGKPCRHGHIAERNVRSGRCLECFREYQQEYQHARRAANLEKVREREREAARKHRTVDPEGYRSQQAAWRAANKEKTSRTSTRFAASKLPGGPRTRTGDRQRGSHNRHDERGVASAALAPQGGPSEGSRLRRPGS
jgi:hypothetical protein